MYIDSYSIVPVQEVCGMAVLYTCLGVYFGKLTLLARDMLINQLGF